MQIREEQQSFQKNRSTVDAICIVREIAEKSLEFNKPVFMRFVDMMKAFGRARLADITEIMRGSHFRTMLKVGNELTGEIQIRTGIRQGDSLAHYTK
ncbi:hypothetical protein Trydic_g11431 [Trypoxylus dichotomus]